MGPDLLEAGTSLAHHGLAWLPTRHCAGGAASHLEGSGRATSNQAESNPPALLVHIDNSCQLHLAGSLPPV